MLKVNGYCISYPQKSAYLLLYKAAGFEAVSAGRLLYCQAYAVSEVRSVAHMPMSVAGLPLISTFCPGTSSQDNIWFLRMPTVGRTSVEAWSV